VVLVSGTSCLAILMHAVFQQTMSRIKFVGRFTPSAERETFADHSAVSFYTHGIKLVLKAKTVDF
jgi:hypothetical protein